MTLNRHSITSQMVLSLVLTSVIIALFGTSFHMWYSLHHEKQIFIHESVLEGDLIADLVTAPLAFFDHEGVNANIQRLNENPDLVMAVIYNAQGDAVASINPYGHPLVPPSQTAGSTFKTSDWTPWNPGSLVTTRPITQNNQILGYLYIEKSSQRITRFIFDLFITSTLFTVVLLVLIYFISRRLSKKILHPILSLAQTAKEVAQSGDYSLRAAHHQDNEISYLFNTFNRLLEETESLTTHLESRVQERTRELQESLSDLQKTQSQLIQAEKMASLGNLVSGVAHEVNTPLGNAITGGSIIVHETKELLVQMENGTLKKSTMQEGLETLNRTASLLLKSITQAADLIRSFKRISVDQSIEEKRDFNLYTYLQEVLLTFHNKIKKVPAAVSLEGDQNLIIRSYPGVYAQIISNFIQNTLLHGFHSPASDARITIRFSVQDTTLLLVYSDNGIGMDETIKTVAFDPFTTTKRNAGGTGLGLNIVYNLVTQKLKGSIDFDSHPGQGVSFTLTLPLDLSNRS